MKHFLALTLLLAASSLSADPLFESRIASPDPDGAPCWSPAGDSLAFVSSRDDNWDVYIVPAKEGDEVAVTDDPLTDIYADWSPTGGWIAFSSARENGSGDGDWDIWMQTLSGDSSICMTDWPGYDNFAAFNPGGDWIAFTSDRTGIKRIWKVKSGDPGSVLPVVSSGPIECFHACWSPDGTRIAFDGRDAEDSTRVRLYTVSAEGGEPVEVPTGFLVSSDPSWSPNGRFLAFAGGDDLVKWNIWLWDMQESELIQVTDTAWPNQSPDWSPDGCQIAYASFPEGNKDVWIAYRLPSDWTSVRRKSWSDLKLRF